MMSQHTRIAFSRVVGGGNFRVMAKRKMAAVVEEEEEEEEEETRRPLSRGAAASPPPGNDDDDDNDDAADPRAGSLAYRKPTTRFEFISSIKARRWLCRTAHLRTFNRTIRTRRSLALRSIRMTRRATCLQSSAGFAL